MNSVGFRILIVVAAVLIAMGVQHPVWRRMLRAYRVWKSGHRSRDLSARYFAGIEWSTMILAGMLWFALMAGMIVSVILGFYWIYSA